MIHHRTHQTTLILHLDNDDDTNRDLNGGYKRDSIDATCVFCDEKFSENTFNPHMRRRMD